LTEIVEWTMARIGWIGGSANEALLGDEEAAALRSVDDPEAFGPLFTRYYPEMVAFCWRRLGDPAEAEDGAGDIFRKAFAARARFQGGSFRAWLYAIAVNTMRDVRKRPAPPTELPLHLHDPAAGPEEQAILSASVAEVRRAVERLPEEWQIVVAMRSEGYPSKEVARSLGRSDDWVRLVHSRAIKQLGRELIGSPAAEGAR
jgi:RNA polymerase sigma-70 factor (ECF subfamily)